MRELNKNAGGSKSLAMKEIEEIYEKGDTDGDFKMDVKEFKQWYLGPLTQWLTQRSASAATDSSSLASTGSSARAKGARSRLLQLFKSARSRPHIVLYSIETPLGSTAQ